MNSEITFPREKNFHLPECRARAKIKYFEVKPARGAKDGSKTGFIHFDADIKGMERFECCARAIFPCEDGQWSKLKLFLQPLLGRDFFLQHSNQRIDLNSVLRGMDCEIDLVHGKHDEKYDWPMVLVENVYPITPAKEADSKK
jgi:hypothetical protein